MWYLVINGFGAGFAAGVAVSIFKSEVAHVTNVAEAVYSLAPLSLLCMVNLALAYIGIKVIRARSKQ